MSRIFDALKQSEQDAKNGKGDKVFPALPETAPVLPEIPAEQAAATPGSSSQAPQGKIAEVPGRPKLAAVPPASPRTPSSQVPPAPPIMKLSPELPGHPCRRP